MERDLELRIKGHLREIEEINDRVIGTRQGYPPAEQGYEKTLESVAVKGDQELVDEIAEFIKSHIEAKGERPNNQMVRRKARSVVSKAGYPIDEYLNRA